MPLGFMAPVRRSLSYWWLAMLVGCLLSTVGRPSAAQAGSEILENFQGVTLNDTFRLHSAAVPPDSMGAAGPDGFVQLVNGAFAVYQKDGTLAQPLITDHQFWINAGISPGSFPAAGGAVTDPRIIYDPSVGRWFASQADLLTIPPGSPSGTQNEILVARSDSSDPTAGWKATSFVGNTTGFSDFPTVGVDAHGVYIGTNNFTSISGAPKDVSLFSIPKADLLASTPTLANMTRFDDLSSAGVGSALQGANDIGGASGAILGIDNTLGFIDLTRVTGSGGPGATLSATTKIDSLLDGQPNSARQPNGTRTIATGDNRLSGSVVQVGNLIYMTNNIGNGPTPGATTHNIVHWIVLDATTDAVLQQGTIGDPNFDFFYPSIAADAEGDVVLAFDRSGGPAAGTAGNISAYAAVGTTTGGVLTFGSPFLLEAGLVDKYSLGPPRTTNRWGDYSATTVDPNDPFDFWTVQEIPILPVNGVSRWATWITEVAVTVPEPGTFSLMGLALLGLAVRRRAGARTRKSTPPTGA
jgi:hypothetical protein